MSNFSQREIAHHANVSLATVSRVMSNSTNVSEDTRMHVLKVIKDLGQGLRPRYLIGVIIPDNKNPFFTDIALMISEELSRKGGAAVIMSTAGSLDKELSTVEAMKSMNVDGTIFIPSSDASDSVVRLASRIEAPVVVLDREIAVSGVDFITTDHEVSIRSAIDFLYASGHRRIACLAGPQETGTGRNRLDAFQAAMRQNSLCVREEDVFFGRFDLISGRRCGEEIVSKSMQDAPTAVFCCNDLMAIGLMQVLQESGWRLPEQMSVVGFDNIEWSSWVYPSLSTVGQKATSLARNSTDLILERIDEVRSFSTEKTKLLEIEYRNVVVKSDFIKRGSISRPRGDAANVLKLVASDN
jgi:DNA-binding LacI/PurR family transcriptional regulator